MPSLAERIYRLFAFLGRYAHQPISDMRNMTTRELQQLASATAEIMEDERKQHHHMTDLD